MCEQTSITILAIALLLEVFAHLVFEANILGRSRSGGVGRSCCLVSGLYRRCWRFGELRFLDQRISLGLARTRSGHKSLVMPTLDVLSILVWLPLFLVSLGAAHVLLLHLVSAAIVIVRTAFLPLITSSLQVYRSVRAELHLTDVVLTSRVATRRVVTAAVEFIVLCAQQASADHRIAILLVLLAVVRHKGHRLMIIVKGAAAAVRGVCV